MLEVKEHSDTHQFGIRAQILFLYFRQEEQEGDRVLKLCKDCLQVGNSP
jgi:hypothetical protein